MGLANPQAAKRSNQAKICVAFVPHMVLFSDDQRACDVLLHRGVTDGGGGVQ